jgi:hypothetical protein
VKRYFEGKDTSESSAQNANINLFFIEKKLDELEKLAAEIDEKYIGSENNFPPDGFENPVKDEKES